MDSNKFHSQIYLVYYVFICLTTACVSYELLMSWLVELSQFIYAWSG